MAGNLIGTDADGTAAIPNLLLAGVIVSSGATNNRIGTDGDGVGDAAERNLISGNSGSGVYIYNRGTTGNVVAGNLIGTNAAGSAALGNLQHGIVISEGAANNRIRGNVISVPGGDKDYWRLSGIAGQTVVFKPDTSASGGFLRLLCQSTSDTSTLASYRTDSPEWETVLDVDALARAEGKSWVYQGVSCLPPDERRCLVYLSDGGRDANTVREFDLGTRQFVEGGFALPEGKQSVAWEDENTILVARDWGPGTMTASGYPFVIKRLRRGQTIDQADGCLRMPSGSDGSPGKLRARPVRASPRRGGPSRGRSARDCA